MSSHEHEQDSVVERYWAVLVITFGVLFVTLLVSFHPSW